MTSLTAATPSAPRFGLPCFSTPPIAYTPVAPSLVTAPALGGLAGKASATWSASWVPGPINVVVASAIALLLAFLTTDILNIFGNWLLNTADRLERLKVGVLATLPYSRQPVLAEVPHNTYQPDPKRLWVQQEMQRGLAAGCRAAAEDAAAAVEEEAKEQEAAEAIAWM